VLHIGARWYDPAVGRWISADAYLGELPLPISRNRYLYCHTDPVNYIDPSGLNAIVVGGAIGGTIACPPGALVGVTIGAAAMLGDYLVWQAFQRGRGEHPIRDLATGQTSSCAKRTIG
jgi:uncharacterized protein RhaS with RHS repeats